MMNLFGLIGLSLLAISFIFLAFKKEEIFITMDFIATIMLLIYSIIIQDLIFISVNSIIVLSLGYRFILLFR